MIIDYVPQDTTWIAKKDFAVAANLDITTLGTLAGPTDVVKSGTIYPANDGTAIGIIVNDISMANSRNANAASEFTAALMVRGVVYSNELPVAPDDEAVAKLRNIQFIDGTGSAVSLSDNDEAIAALNVIVSAENTGLVDLVASLDTRVDTAEDDIAALETTIDTETTGLVDRVEALEGAGA